MLTCEQPVARVREGCVSRDLNPTFHFQLKTAVNRLVDEKTLIGGPYNY